MKGVDIMREILFRGKKDNGKWIEGFLCKKYFQEKPHDRYAIMHKTEYDPKRWQPDYMTAEVIPETIGQFTGLTDKNGKKIFEGDIVLTVYDNGVRGSCYVVEMSNERGGWFPFATDDGCGCCSCEVCSTDNAEIIGNIHDNPELLERN